MSESQSTLTKLSPYFVRGRTHFKFFSRCCTWLAAIFSFFARFINRFLTVIPFWGSFVRILDPILDGLAFGSNQNLPGLARSVAFLGYGLLMLTTFIGFFYPPLAAFKALTILSITLGMFFEAQTILVWFNNYKQLENQRLFTGHVDTQSYNNAVSMVNAAVITFLSMAIKAFAVSLSTIMPSATIVLFIIAQTAEVSAMIGSIGKETVNINQNITSLREMSYFTDSYTKLHDKMPYQSPKGSHLFQDSAEVVIDKTTAKKPTSVKSTTPYQENNPVALEAAQICAI